MGLSGYLHVLSAREAIFRFCEKISLGVRYSRHFLLYCSVHRLSPGVFLTQGQAPVSAHPDYMDTIPTRCRNLDVPGQPRRGRVTRLYLGNPYVVAFRCRGRPLCLPIRIVPTNAPIPALPQPGWTGETPTWQRSGVGADPCVCPSGSSPRMRPSQRYRNLDGPGSPARLRSGVGADPCVCPSGSPLRLR